MIGINLRRLKLKGNSGQDAINHIKDEIKKLELEEEKRFTIEDW